MMSLALSGLEYIVGHSTQKVSKSGAKTLLGVPNSPKLQNFPQKDQKILKYYIESWVYYKGTPNTLKSVLQTLYCW